jgi:hypothetical protein
MSVWKLSSNLEYLENQLHGLDVMWQPGIGDLTSYAWTVTLLWDYSVGSEMLLNELVYCVTAVFTMTEWVDQWICIKFCFKAGHSSAATTGMIKKASRDWFNEWSPDKSVVPMIQRWPSICWKRFMLGRPATGRTPKNVEHMQAAINENWWLTVWDLEEDLGIPRTVVSEILMKDLGMNHVAAKLIPQLL